MNFPKEMDKAIQTAIYNRRPMSIITANFRYTYNMPEVAFAA